jgi:hypothetical protein
VSLFEDPPLHDFPDRAIRRLLEDPENLRDLIAAVLPDLVERFDFHQMQPVPKTFLLDDWRKRESDLLFRLSPIVPIIFHTGSTVWRTHRVMGDLIGGPEELRPFAPRWEPLFWDLAERNTDALLASAGEWLAALAVVRAEGRRKPRRSGKCLPQRCSGWNH